MSMTAITLLSTDTVISLEMSLRQLRRFVANDAKYAHPNSTIRSVLAEIDKTLANIERDKQEFGRYKNAVQLALMT